MPDGPYAVVTGGGTSGHVLPALAVAEGLVARGHDPSTIHYAGCRRGIETRLLPDTPFPHHFYEVDGFQRSLSKRNLSFVPKMWRARREAIERFRASTPKVVVSVGGYASMPSVFAARKLDIPIVVVSYDRKPGRASQVAAKRAAACGVAFPDSPLPNATLTGAPVRQSILDVDRVADRASARAALELPEDRFVVAIMGGSQGSRILNDAVRGWIEQVGDDETLAVRHATGERFLERALPSRDGSDGVLYQPIGYETRMPLVYAAADVLVGRGGASTVHEVAATGTPAVLVPWAASADDHQTLNARWLADDGGAVMLPEADVARLGDTLDELRHDPARRDELARRAARAGQVHRSGALARLVESVADRRA